MDKKIVSSNIIVELKTERIWWRIKEQKYNDGTSYYNMLHNGNFQMIDTDSSNIKDIIKYVEKEITFSEKYKDITGGLNEEGKQKITDLIKDMKNFLIELKKVKN